MESNHKKYFDKYSSNPFYTLNDLSRDLEIPIPKICMLLKEEGYIFRIADELERSFFVNTLKNCWNETAKFARGFFDLLVLALKKAFDFLMATIKNFEIYRTRIIGYIKDFLVCFGLCNPDYNNLILGVY